MRALDKRLNFRSASEGAIMFGQPVVDLAAHLLDIDSVNPAQMAGRPMSTLSTYREIKADILGRIQAQEWPLGSRLPAETELAAHYGSARATVSRAMRELADDGIVERRRKTGTRVRLSPVRQARFGIPIVRSEIEEAGAVYRYALVRSQVVVPPDFLRARMSLPEKAEVRHVVCMHFADGNPYQFEDRWISLLAVPDARTADFTEISPNEWLVRQVPFTRAEISFSAADATEQQAQHLDCNPGDALFCIERQTEWETRAVTFVRMVYRRGHRMTTRY